MHYIEVKMYHKFIQLGTNLSMHLLIFLLLLKKVSL